MDETVNTRVIFGAVKKIGFYVHDLLTFDEEIINVGNGMDIQSGKFKAPVEGYYSFSFSGTAYECPRTGCLHYFDGAIVNVYKNEEVLFEFHDFHSEGSGKLRVLSGQWMAKLNEGDTIHLSVDEGYMTTGWSQRIYFTGQLLLKSD